jgi:hypothetical protein
MDERTLPRTMSDLTDMQLLELADEPEFLEVRTALERHLLNRLDIARCELEAAEADRNRMLQSMWALAEGASLGRVPVHGALSNDAGAA